MLRRVGANFVFSALAQGGNLVATLMLAFYMGETRFADFSVDISAATILSIFVTLQIERSYVRLDVLALPAYVASHLTLCLAVTALLTPLVGLALDAPDVVFTAFAVSVNQSVTYYLAGTQQFPRLWLIRGLQASVLALLVIVLINTQEFELATWAYGLSWLLSAVVMLDRSVWSNIPRQTISSVVRCLSDAFEIARSAVLTMSFFSIVREGPVLAAGFLHNDAVAAALGLCNRVVSQPLALLARSVALALASAATVTAAGPLARRITLTLAAVSTTYCLVFATIAANWESLAIYTSLSSIALILTPMYVSHALIGSLGPYLISRMFQFREMVMFFIQAATAVILMAYLWLADGSFLSALTVLSATVTISTLTLLIIVSRREIPGDAEE